MKSVQQVQRDLVTWGKFWHRKEQGAGYASKSVTGRLCETLETGIFSSGTAIQESDRADSIYVPPHIEHIDDSLKYLTLNERKWLRKKYVRQYNDNFKVAIRYTNIFIDRAENRLCGLL